MSRRCWIDRPEADDVMGVWDAVKVEEDVWASCCRRRLLLSEVFLFLKGERKKEISKG